MVVALGPGQVCSLEWKCGLWWCRGDIYVLPDSQGLNCLCQDLLPVGKRESLDPSIWMFSEFEVYWVLYFDDFPQRGINKLQKHSQLRYNRPEAAVEVLCHCVVYENDHDLDDQVFKDGKIAPSANDWHPLFRPVSEDFFRIFKKRIKLDEDLGQKVIWTILNQFLTEVSALPLGIAGLGLRVWARSQK